MTSSSIPPALFVLALLWVVLEAVAGWPVGLQPAAFRLVAGVMAGGAAVGIVLIAVADWVVGVKNL